MWFTQGYDSTIHWFFFKSGWASQEMAMYEGIGIHWSTLFYFAFGTLNLSFLLRKSFKIVGFHNIAYSTIIGFWVSAMIFELPYVPLMDWFHNFNEVTRFPILLSGWNTIYLGASGMAGAEAPRWIMVALIIYPTAASIGTLLLFRKFGDGLIKAYGFQRTEKIVYTTFSGVFVISLFGTHWFLMNVGIFPVLIRNFGWFLGLPMAYVILLDALQNPYGRKKLVGFTFRFKDPKLWALISAFICAYVCWVIYPITGISQVFPAEIVKGYWFPQTVYAFYESKLPIIKDQIWVPNVGIWAFNHLIVKPLAVAIACYGFAPKKVET
jgi:hypothetical protein